MSDAAFAPLTPTLVVTSAGLLGLVSARLARIGPIITFFLIGALAGPYGLGLADNQETALMFLSELGIALLLIDVGLHLSLHELREQWRALVELIGPSADASGSAAPLIHEWRGASGMAPYTAPNFSVMSRGRSSSTTRS